MSPKPDSQWGLCVIGAPLGGIGGWTLVLVGCASGAEDSLSRLIGMRLLGVHAGLLDGAYSRGEGGSQQANSKKTWRDWVPRRVLFTFFKLWASREAFPSKRTRRGVPVHLAFFGTSISSSHDEDIYIESSSEVDEQTSPMRTMFTQSLRTFDADALFEHIYLGVATKLPYISSIYSMFQYNILLLLLWIKYCITVGSM